MDLNAIILLLEGEGYTPHDTPLLGKQMWQWAAGAADKFCTVKIDASLAHGQTLLQAVRPSLDQSKFTAILYSDTPLIQKSTLCEAATHLSECGESALKLVRGFVFETEYLKNCEQFPTLSTYYCGDDDFVYAPDYSRLSVVSDTLRRRINEYHMKSGVYILDPSTTYIDCDVAIGRGVTIYPSNVIEGKTIIAEGAVLEPRNHITNSIIGRGAKLASSRLIGAKVGAVTSVGPFAYLREGSDVGDRCRIGDFVELKKARIGNGTKISHLSYVGDAVVGENCNIGCGVVFVNYNGKIKSQTTVGDNAFIGSNCNLIAPISVECGAFVAAGSTLTDNVPKKALAIARARQVNKPDWVK